ncbi:hypothetical protein CD351_14075 [Erythrobacter sp. KY5]|uniref:c-type cytochrome n=1 Tax=Erythrobacter sp. KY5 TaxID=2011159 RepID=UPI000DBF2DBB|nr:c-type cytochrome [Erythrobacter sp. KY5]AWW75560.1 hypothetical protein CD351_14075 [Erythrobacter sp. KY5]
MKLRAIGAAGLVVLSANVGAFAQYGLDTKGNSEGDETSPYSAEEIAFGREVFGMCDGCHTLAPGGSSAAGPNLHGIIGREAGSLDGYLFTDALRGSGITWDAVSLDAYLADPEGYVPGTDMQRGTVREPDFRRALIAYLSHLSDQPASQTPVENGE